MRPTANEVLTLMWKITFFPLSCTIPRNWSTLAMREALSDHGLTWSAGMGDKIMTQCFIFSPVVKRLVPTLIIASWIGVPNFFALIFSVKTKVLEDWSRFVEPQVIGSGRLDCTSPRAIKSVSHASKTPSL